MPKSLKNKMLFDPATNKEDMASQKFPHTFIIVGNTCTNKLCRAATAHLHEQSDLHACHYMALLVAITRTEVNSEQL